MAINLIRSQMTQLWTINKVQTSQFQITMGSIILIIISKSFLKRLRDFSPISILLCLKKKNQISSSISLLFSIITSKNLHFRNSPFDMQMFSMINQRIPPFDMLWGKKSLRYFMVFCLFLAYNYLNYFLDGTAICCN